MGFRFEQTSMTLNDLEGQYAYAVIGNQNIISNGLNVQPMLV